MVFKNNGKKYIAKQEIQGGRSVDKLNLKKLKTK